jgi:hypothetical protein
MEEAQAAQVPAADPAEAASSVEAPAHVPSPSAILTDDIVEAESTATGLPHTQIQHHPKTPLRRSRPSTISNNSLASPLYSRKHMRSITSSATSSSSLCEFSLF